MPVSPDIPHPEDAQNHEDISRYPYLATFLRANAPLADAIPNDNENQVGMPLTEWQQEFHEAHTRRIASLAKDCSFLGEELGNHLAEAFVQGAAYAIIDENPSFYMHKIDREGMTRVLSAVLLIGHELHDAQVITKYSQEIFDVLKNYGGIIDNVHVRNRVNIILQIGQHLWERANTIPSAFYRGDYDFSPQKDSEGTPRSKKSSLEEELQKFIEGLNMDGI